VNEQIDVIKRRKNYSVFDRGGEVREIIIKKWGVSPFSTRLGLNFF